MRLLKSSSPSLKVIIDQPIIYTRPNLVESEPNEDVFLHGCVELSLPSTRVVKTLKVVLKSVCEIYAGPGPAFERSSNKIEIVLALDQETLEPGSHLFNFTFIIPANSAPYQRCSYGRQRQHIKAVLEFENLPTKRNTFTSDPTSIWIFQNNNMGQDIFSDYHDHIERNSEFLGPVSVSFSSPHLCPGSSLKVDLLLPEVPENVEILEIKTQLTQGFDIIYESHCQAKISPEPQIYILKNLKQSSSPSTSSAMESVSCSSASTHSSDETSSCSSSSIKSSKSSKFARLFNSSRTLRAIVPKEPLAFIKSGGEQWSYTQLNQIPRESIIRPSTLSETNSRLKIHHKIALRIRYRFEGKKEEMLLTVFKKVTIASCKCHLDTPDLPTYSYFAPKSTLTVPTSTATRRGDQRCECTQESIDMVNFHSDYDRLQRLDLGSSTEVMDSKRVDGEISIPGLGLRI